MNCANVETIKWVAQAIYPEGMQRIAENQLNTRILSAYKHVLDFEYNE